MLGSVSELRNPSLSLFFVDVVVVFCGFIVYSVYIAFPFSVKSWDCVRVCLVEVSAYARIRSARSRGFVIHPFFFVGVVVVSCGCIVLSGTSRSPSWDCVRVCLG